MKIISLIAVFILLSVNALAQNPKVVAEITASSEKLVKNSPFSGEAVSESVQMLADGNRIVRSSTSKLYRNSEGRFRREMAPGTGGALGSLYTYGQGVTLLDPVGGFRYMIDPNLRTTRQMVLKPKSEITIVNGSRVTGQGGVIDTSKLREELKAATAAGQNGIIVTHKDGKMMDVDKLREELKAVTAAAPAMAAQAGQIVTETMSGFGSAYFGSHPKWESRTDELGTQNFEGVDAEGTRTVTTIPAGAIGNERPIEITYEKWYSRELQLVVMSKHNDPRFGEQTYRLTNIVRSEPDPSLFTLPSGYRLITEPGGTYTVSPKAVVQYDKAAPVKGSTNVIYTKTKP